MTAPTPLPANSRKLRDHRFAVDVYGPKNERGGYPNIATGRFLTDADARAWADEVYPDAFGAAVTYYSARTGWRSQFVASRRDGAWGGAFR